MKAIISLSKREKQYNFLYLIGLLIITIFVLSLIFLRSFESPFNSFIELDGQLLDQKNKFFEQQEIVEPLIETTFRKIHILQNENLQPFAENDIKNSINDVANCFEKDNIYDSRKNGYFQIALFYKMYFEDKKIAAKKHENIKNFTKQFEECMIGFKEKEQQQNQIKSALLSRKSE
jgi:hypothetical protein